MAPSDPKLVGELWPAGQPLQEPSRYGRVTLHPTGEFEARSLQTFTMTYTAGLCGIDDTGALRVVFRSVQDSPGLQTTNPTAPNYVTATANNGATLKLDYNSNGHMRPRNRSLTISVTDGFIRAGDTITIIFGDRSAGSPGMQLQSYCESNFEFKLLVDVYATGHFVPLPETPTIQIVPGPPVRWQAIAPTLRRVGERPSLGLRADDAWGNPSDQVSENLRIESNHPIENLPAQVSFTHGQPSLRIDNLAAQKEGIYRIRVFSDDKTHLVDANPLVVRNGSQVGYWGDLHGQTGETVGIGTAREYLNFARDRAFLDVTSHQGNDFQITPAFWEKLNRLTAEFYEKGRFVTFPGYEWSGNTGVGGDHNVYFRKENRPIRRSSHSLLEDAADISSDAPTLKDLFDALADEDSVVYAHVGGRYADPGYAHDPKIETAMELHSAWGTFEWLLTDGFAMGHRCGVVCNSDDHKCRPGASHPGATTFGAFGGLTCFLTPELSREALFECLRRRHHYGTTGNRLHLDVRARFASAARLFERNPRVYSTTARQATEIMMGDIAQTDDQTVDLCLEAVTRTPIERIEVLNAKQVVHTLRGYSRQDLGQRIRVIWSGAKYRGRARRSRWIGKMRLTGARITQLKRINFWNREQLFEQRGDSEIVWDSITTGNFVGFDVWFDGQDNAQLELETNFVSAALPLQDIGIQDTVFDAGGLERRLRVFRMPETNGTYTIRETVPVALHPKGDNPLWVRLTTDDGYNAWSSPMFIYRKED